MKNLVTYDTEPTGHDVKPFGRKNAKSTDRRLLFDRKLLVHTRNSIVGIVYEIKRAKKAISLQRISTVPLEKKFRATQLHAGVHQTLGELVKTMDIDQGMKLVYVQEQIKIGGLHMGKQSLLAMFSRNWNHAAYFWRGSISYHWISSSCFTAS
jgi:hypothetical protein